jgi:hypothetical protein
MPETSSEFKKELEGKVRAEPAKILIDDDEPGIQETLQDTLAQEGYKTETAQTSKENKVVSIQEQVEQSFIVELQKKFDEYLLEAIDEALTSLGVPVKNTIYFQLENNFNIPKNEIPKKIDDFASIIHKIFGLGAKRLEMKILKNLYSKIMINIELAKYEDLLSKWLIDDISFVEYVYYTRNNYYNMQEKTQRALPKK